MHDNGVASSEAMRIRCSSTTSIATASAVSSSSSSSSSRVVLDDERASVSRPTRAAQRGKHVVAMVELDGGRDGVGGGIERGVGVPMRGEVEKRRDNACITTRSKRNRFKRGEE